jgi:hypothetical protein
MLTPDQIRRRAHNRFEDFLRSLCTGESFFPFAVFGAGMSKVVDFEADRAAIEALRKHSKEEAGFGYSITWEERNSRRFGLQKIPGELSFETHDDYVRFIGKVTEVRQFQSDYELIRCRCQELLSWVQTKPSRIIAHAGSWDGLLNVCLYLKDHPCPDCYLRELPVVVDTKFVERHTGILSELLPISAPATVRTNDGRFEMRFGFRFKQPLVRARFLDLALATHHGFLVSDFATPLDQFRNLPFGGSAVLIVENEMTFLTLPSLPKTIAIWGAGDAAALLTTVGWLNSCQPFYWGDMDPHGFETLSHLRRHFSSVRSVLMDAATFHEHSFFAVSAGEGCTKVRLELSSEERSHYDYLVEKGKLLEQERIPNAYSAPRLLQAIIGCGC